MSSSTNSQANDVRRKHIVDELCATEASYVRGLRQLRDEWREPMARARRLPLSPVELKHLFPQVCFFFLDSLLSSCIVNSPVSFSCVQLDALLRLNEELLAQLDARQRDWQPRSTCIGDVFCDLTPVRFGAFWRWHGALPRSPLAAHAHR